jgi:hypothetical protein
MITVTDKDYVVVECVLRSDVLRYRMQGLVRDEVQSKVGELVDAFQKQVCRDALIGTYDDYREALFGSRGASAFQQMKLATDAAARIYPEFGSADMEAGLLPIRLELQAKWFKEPRIGFQHLIHVLCGDIFGRGTGPMRGSVEVKRVTLGRLGTEFRAFYGQRSHSIAGIRELFALNNAPLIYGAAGQTGHLPLLAFSFKPRNGLTRTDFKRIAEGVLKAGFNIVEVDVRNVDFMDSSWRSTFGEIASSAVGITSHVARFSLNVSGPADLAVQYAAAFKALHPAGGPWVLKVDGGLDGLSTVQALRSFFGNLSEQPIITCYPILSDMLAAKIGAETFREMLVLSGADIIYPGAAPRISAGDFVDYEAVERGVRRYEKLMELGRPMLSIAGGVHAGQLPAYYDVLSPAVAFFLGGGVALHRNGAFYEAPTGLLSRPARKPKLGERCDVRQAVGGAELCRFAVEAAASEQDGVKLRAMLEDTQQHYLELVEGQNPGKKFQFVDPDSVLVGSIRSLKEQH